LLATRQAKGGDGSAARGVALHLRWAPVRNPVLRNLEFPLTAIIGIIERERRGGICTPKSDKAKLEQLCLARLNHRDQAVRLLDMQKLQAIKTHKPTTVIFKHF
jgi:hypothetical protein